MIFMRLGEYCLEINFYTNAFVISRKPGLAEKRIVYRICERKCTVGTHDTILPAGREKLNVPSVFRTIL